MLPESLTSSDISALISRVAKHDRAAFAKLYEATAPKLLGVVLRIVKDRQDIVRLAYLSGWSREELANQYEQPVNTVKTWLRRALQDIKGCLES